MLLRSSSTPALGSLIPSFSESPNHHLSAEPHPALKHPTPPTHHHHHIKPPLPLNCSLSPLPRSAVEPSGSSFRRSNSEGNLIGLDANPDDHFRSTLPRPPKCSQRRSIESDLEKIPSSSFHYILRYENEDCDDDEEKEYFGRGNVGVFRNSSLGVETIDDIRFLNACKSLEFVEQEAHGKEMYLAMELGMENLNIGFGGSGGRSGGDFVPVAYGRDGGDGKRQGAEEHYKKLIEENPGNPLFLRNYAQYLFESKKDLTKSEELYLRAILANPGDGEILSQYAKLIWELHHDRDRALNYFERAVQAAPADSHVHAAYASFLWEIDGDEEEDKDGSLCSSSIFSSHFFQGITSSASI